jgi:uncharacterized membrane protein YhdT
LPIVTKPAMLTRFAQAHGDARFALKCTLAPILMA